MYLYLRLALRDSWYFIALTQHRYITHIPTSYTHTINSQFWQERHSSETNMRKKLEKPKPQWQSAQAVKKKKTLQPLCGCIYICEWIARNWYRDDTIIKTFVCDCSMFATNTRKSTLMYISVFLNVGMLTESIVLNPRATAIRKLPSLSNQVICLFRSKWN